MYRTAVTGPKGIVPPAELLAEIGAEGMPELPDHIKAWIAAEDARPWPPMSEG